MTRLYDNSPSRTRTYNLAVNSRSLYQLSYRGFWAIQRAQLYRQNRASQDESLRVRCEYSDDFFIISG